MVRAAAAVAAALVVMTSDPGTAVAAPEDYFPRLVAAVRAELDRAIAARAPKLVAPVPIKVRWKAVRVGSLDLRAPLVAFAGGDLDGDGKGELYVVTTREVIAVALADKRVKELGRVAFGGPPAVPASRDVIGTAVVEAGQLVAATSGWATELRVAWADKTLTARPGGAGFLACPGERMTRVPGRNHFGDLAAPIYGVRCRDGLVDPQGHPLRARAVLAGTRLEVAVERCAAGDACAVATKYEYKDYGAAFELADFGRDGQLEVVVTGAGARGDADAVKVIPLGTDDKGVFRHRFNGGVAGLAALDLDGDGAPELVAAVRLAGSSRIDLWRFN